MCDRKTCPAIHLSHFLPTLQGAEHDLQPHTQANREAALVHLELRGVMGAWRTTGRDSHPEIATGPLLEEQAHVVTGHPRIAVFDSLSTQFDQGTLLDEGFLRGLIDHGGTALRLQY